MISNTFRLFLKQLIIAKMVSKNKSLISLDLNCIYY